MTNARILLKSLLRIRLLLAAPILLLWLAPLGGAWAQGFGAGNADADLAAPFGLIPSAIYETSFRKDNAEIFSRDGTFLGLVGKINRPTGLAFDKSGNLLIASDDSGSGYEIKKVATDGLISTFTKTGLSGPHGLAFDEAGNLYVANYKNNTVTKYTPDGTASVFADRADKLSHPVGLAFDAAGNLFVSNATGGPTRSGRVVKVTPNGVGTVFADIGFQTAYGIALDSTGYLYVSNNGSHAVEKFAPDGTDLGVFCDSGLSAPLGIMFDEDDNLYVANAGNATIEKFAPDGTDLGVFATTRGGPHFMAIYYAEQMQAGPDD